MFTGLNEVQTRAFFDARYPTKIFREASNLYEVETLTFFTLIILVEALILPCTFRGNVLSFTYLQ